MRAPTACRRTVSGTISLFCPKCFSPFPHGTGPLSVSREYLALPDGPGGFTQDSSCPALLRMPLRLIRVHVRSCHALWRHFPEPSIPLTSCDGAGLFPVRSPLLGESLLFSFPAGTKMFQFPALASIPDGCHPFRMTGCPIRKSADQRLCAPPRGFSQLAASFIASESLGIRRAPFLTFSAAAGIGGLAYTLALFVPAVCRGFSFALVFTFRLSHHVIELL